MNYIAHKFSRQADADFMKTLRQRVNEYFRTNNISRYANANMVIKTICMLSLYFVPYFLMLFGVFENSWILFLMWVIMAGGMSGIGLSIMHDANHGSYSKNKTVNQVLSYLINFVGGNVANWRIQHNVLHHTFTNIEGADQDMDGPFFLRFSPHKKRIPIHRFQHIYAWFFYSLMTLYWATAKEFIQLVRFKKLGLTQTPKRYRRILTGLIFWKIFYIGYSLVLPMIFIPASPWFVLLCYCSMHFITGLVLSIVFQAAHIMDTSEYPLPDSSGEIQNNWAVHQLLNTANFAPKSRILSWFVGGLNFQIEHHLFPDICHVHYKKVSEIVKSTAEQFGLPYHSNRTFLSALVEHARMLKKLGRPEFA